MTQLGQTKTLKSGNSKHGTITSKVKSLFLLIGLSLFLVFIQTVYRDKGNVHIHVNSAVGISSHFVPNSNSNVKTIRFVGGYYNVPWITTSDLATTFIKKSYNLCGGYRCQILTGKYVHIGKEDMTILFGFELPNTPPKRKNIDQLWVFFSEEPQQYLPGNPSPAWNGQFNYSFTFLRQSEANQAGAVFSARFQRRRERLNRNFAKEKLTLGRTTEFTNRTANALWFVSNCKPVGTAYEVGSNRLEYTMNLSRYVHVDAFSSHHPKFPNCPKLLGNLLRTDEKKWNPQYNDYWFYLSFENNHCKDYITEKFWKILTQDLLVIPIVMGPSIKEYERVSPPNSFIHVDNFTSPEHLSKHLHYIASNTEAFNYYLQWRNEYEFITPEIQDIFTRKLCYLCKLAHERPQRTWDNFTSEFNKSDCRISR